MKKRIVSIALVIIMAAMLLAPCVHADGFKMTLEVGTATAKAGSSDTVRLPIKATVNTGYCSGVLRFKWDSKALELVDIEFSSLAPDQGSPAVSNTGEHSMRVGNSLSHDNFMGTGDFITAVFKVIPSAAAGKYDVQISHTDFLDTDLNDIVVTTVPGSITLNGSGKPEEGGGSSSGGGATEKTAEGETQKSGGTSESAAESKASDATQGSSVNPSGEKSGSPAASGGSPVIWILIAAIAVVGVIAGVIFVKGRKKKQ